MKPERRCFGFRGHFADALFVSLFAASAASAAVPPPPCVAQVPTQIESRLARWLGQCPAHRADGLGILRAGAKEPYDFFVGRMRAGRPVRGLVIRNDFSAYTPAMAFKPNGDAILADGDHLTEQDDTWKQAEEAARLTAARFAAAGNSASAAYYRRFAVQRVSHAREP